MIGTRTAWTAIILALASLITTCSSDAGAEPELYVGIKYNPAAMSVGGSGFSRYDLLLLPDGRALSIVPSGGDLSLPEAEWKAIEPRYRGTWTANGSEVRLYWSNRRVGRQSQVYLRSKGGLSINSTQLDLIHCDQQPRQLSGSYRARTFASTGSRQMRTGEINFASERQLSFSRNGTVSGRSRSGVSTDSTSGGRIIGSSGDGLTGTYDWEDNCRLTISTGNGSQVAHTAFFWPGEKGKTLVLDGRMYDRTDH